MSNDVVPVTITVNGRKETGFAAPRMLLSDFLRQQLGLTGFFYPDFALTAAGPTSIYPAAKYPVLSLAAWQGDLGLDSGVPQSVYSLPVAGLKNIGVTQLRPSRRTTRWSPA